MGINRRIVAALILSTLASLGYAALALYILFAESQQDKVMFLLLVVLFVEVLIWAAYMMRTCCSWTSNPHWHLKRMTMPYWDVFLVLIVTSVTLQLQQIHEISWWNFDELSLYGQITVVGGFIMLGTKIISNALLVECYHRQFVKDNIMDAYELTPPSFTAMPYSPSAPFDNDNK